MRTLLRENLKEYRVDRTESTLRVKAEMPPPLPYKETVVLAEEIKTGNEKSLEKLAEEKWYDNLKTKLKKDEKNHFIFKSQRTNTFAYFWEKYLFSHDRDSCEKLIAHLFPRLCKSFAPKEPLSYVKEIDGSYCVMRRGRILKKHKTRGNADLHVLCSENRTVYDADTINSAVSITVLKIDKIIDNIKRLEKISSISIHNHLAVWNYIRKVVKNKIFALHDKHEKYYERFQLVGSIDELDELYGDYDFIEDFQQEGMFDRKVGRIIDMVNSMGDQVITDALIKHIDYETIAKKNKLNTVGAVKTKVFRAKNLIRKELEKEMLVDRMRDGEKVTGELKINVGEYTYVANYKDGILNGKSKKYAKNILLSEANFDYGVLDGEYKEYDENGNVKLSGIYKNGIKIGLWNEYKSGKRIGYEYWNGEIVGIIENGLWSFAGGEENYKYRINP